MVNAGQFKPAQVQALMLCLSCGEGRLGTISPSSTGGFGLPGPAPPGSARGWPSVSPFMSKWGLGQGFSLERQKGSRVVCERNRFPYFWEVEVESLAELLCSPHTLTPAGAGAWECSQADLIACSRPTLASFTWLTWAASGRGDGQIFAMS